MRTCGAFLSMQLTWFISLKVSDASLHVTTFCNNKADQQHIALNSPILFANEPFFDGGNERIRIERERERENWWRNESIEKLKEGKRGSGREMNREIWTGGTLYFCITSFSSLIFHRKLIARITMATLQLSLPLLFNSFVFYAQSPFHRWVSPLCLRALHRAALQLSKFIPLSSHSTRCLTLSIQTISLFVSIWPFCILNQRHVS